MADDETITIEHSDGHTVVRVNRDLGIPDREAHLFAVLEQLRAARTAHILLDLDAVATLSTTAIAQLVSCYMRFRKEQLDLRISRISTAAHALLSAVHIHEIIEIPPASA